MERFSGLIGFVGILAIAYLLSTNRRAIRWKTVFWGLTLQIVTAIAVLRGTQIADLFRRFMPALNPWIAALIFAILTIIV
ncbi:MAG TPA: Na+ dependent nucleoside transporter N-terminal domain-containing protein, partial [Thermoanaerobaculia bacterium]|nr:Na+ dependent nucleoside transporter N-terminal domain-containing protein [Thermoanaerobaculia bacterium]